MINTALRFIRSLAQAVFFQTALSAAGAGGDTDTRSDQWLFEEETKTQRLSALPAYPETRSLTDGERHRLDMLDTTLRSIQARLNEIREMTSSVHSAAARISSTFVEERQLCAAAPLAHTSISRVADPIVTDMLFEAAGARQELDSELFEIEHVETYRMRTLPAWQIDQLDRMEPGQTSHSGG